MLKLPFNIFKPYPEDKQPVVDLRRKPGQVKSLGPSEKESISKVSVVPSFKHLVKLTVSRNNFTDIRFLQPIHVTDPRPSRS